MKQEQENTKNWKPVGALVEELANRVRRLGPDHRDPHRFYEEKSDIAFQLSQLAQKVRA